LCPQEVNISNNTWVKTQNHIRSKEVNPVFSAFETIQPKRGDKNKKKKE
jgi:hypothetical protein